MRDFFVLWFVIILAPMTVCGQPPRPNNRAWSAAKVKELVAQECKKGWQVSTPSSDPRGEFLYVAQRYSVGDAKLTRVGSALYYSVEVDRFTGGRIDPWWLTFFEYAKMPGSLQVGPITSEGAGPNPHSNSCVTLNTRAVLHLVTELRDKSQDPVVRDNGDRTIMELRGMLKGEPIQPVPAPESAAAFLHRFWTLENSGRGLTPEGRRAQAEYFAVRPAPNWKYVLVIGGGPGPFREKAMVDARGDLASVAFDYDVIGYLRSSMRLTYTAPGAPREVPNCCGVHGGGYTLRLSRKYWETEPDGSLKEMRGPLAWRILNDQALPPTPWVNLVVATRYVRHVRDTTKDSAIKANAEKTLAALNRFR